MASNRKIYRIKDIAAAMGDAPFGSSLKNLDYTATGALVVQGKNIQGRICDCSDQRYVSLEKYHSLSRSHCFPGDLIFPKVGTIGKVGILTPFGNQKEYLLSTNTMRLQPDENVACRDYVYYYFTSPKIVNLIQALNSKSVQPVFNFTTLRNFEIPLPPLPVQQAIAHTLSTLDDKINLNQQMNKTLESIARALFKSWFVDFDPVRAKMEGRQPYGMDAETAALFPEDFEDSQLGKIPKGWNVKPLSDCVIYLSRGIAPSYLHLSPIQVLNQRAIRWWHIDEQALKFHDPNKPVRKEAYIRKGDVVINSTGDITIGRAYWFYHEMADLIADSHVSIIRTSLDVLLPEMVVFQIETQSYQDIIYSYVTGSTGQLELNRSNLAQLPFLCPPIELQRKFSVIIEPWFNLIWNNKEQSRVLAAIRDALLPKLLSGEIRVRDTEKFIEARA